MPDRPTFRVPDVFLREFERSLPPGWERPLPDDYRGAVEELILALKRLAFWLSAGH